MASSQGCATGYSRGMIQPLVRAAHRTRAVPTAAAGARRCTPHTCHSGEGLMVDSRVLDLLEAPCVCETAHGALEGGGVAVPQALEVSSRVLRLPAHCVA